MWICRRREGYAEAEMHSKPSVCRAASAGVVGSLVGSVLSRGADSGVFLPFGSPWPDAGAMQFFEACRRGVGATIEDQSDGRSAGRGDEADAGADVERGAEVEADVAVEAPAR